jgi:TP901 family phage tail tape measure protein
MSDFQVKVGGDFSEVLRGFQQLPAAASQAGDGIGRSLNEPLQQSTKSLAALQNELRALKASQAKLPLDSSEYRAAGAEVDKLKAQITALASKPTKLPVDASDAPAAANQFRLLDGVVQGIAFSLSNTLTNAAGAALQAVSNIPRTISQFDTARAAVSTLGVDTSELGRNLAGLSRELNNNVSQVELMQAAYDVASSGFSDAASNTEVMRAAALLATGGFTDLQTAGDGLTSVLNAYGLSAEDATKVTDSIIQTQNDGKIVAGEYAREIGRLAPTAKASGVSLEELNAAISGATAQGVPVGSTFAGIQQAIVSILKPSQDASKYAKELGIEWNASALQAKGLGGFLQQLVEKGAASSESIIRLTGSTEAQTALMPLLNDGLQKYNQFLDNQRGSAGAAADASEKATATIDGSLKRLQNTISNLTVEAFQGLAPIISGAINVVTGFVEAIASIPAPIRALGGVLVGLTGAFAATAVAVAAFNSTLIQGQIAAAGAAFTSLAATISGTLGAVVPVATVAMGKLMAAIMAASTTQFTFSGIAAAIQTGIVAAANAGTAAFGRLALAITSGSLISGIQAFTAANRAALVALGQLAVAVGFVVAAISTWQYVLGGAKKVTDEFAASQKAVSQALVVMQADLEKTAEKAKETQFNFLGLGQIFRDAREGWTLLALVDETEKLEEGFSEVFDTAMKFFQELKNSEEITDAQRQQAAAYLKELEKVAAAYRQQAEAAKLAAVEAARVGNADEAKFREAQAKTLESNARALDNLTIAYQKELGILPQKTAATKADTAAGEEAKKAAEDRAKAEAELNKILASAPIRNLEGQVALGQQLLNLSKALADREQSRFAVVKAGLEFELAQAEKRGASEQQIGRIKDRIQQLDRAALEARYAALQQEQQLQLKMLELSQQKARLEADLSVQQQRAEILKAQADLQKAASDEERAAARAQLELQQAIYGIKNEQVALLRQTQPLEKAIQEAQFESAINGERAKAAQMGYRFEADGSLKAVAAIADASSRVGVITAGNAQEQARLTSVAQQTGLAIERAADGSFVLGRNQQDVTSATDALNRQLATTARGAQDAAGAADDISAGLGRAASPADGIASAFTSTGQSAPKAAQGARDFAGWLSGAKTFSEQIASLPLEGQMGTVASRTEQAAGAAKVFYEWLYRASQLPGSRWTGGPVEAGEQYRVNELGQEALLHGGRLSLINAAPNSLWRAPTNGTVIPAGITSRLQEQGALPGRGGAAAPMGGGGSSAALAIEIGKLRQEVGELARKQWNVNVTTRTGPTGSQVMRSLLR